MSGSNSKLHTLESAVKRDFIKFVARIYPTSHPVVIPATHWRLLPYDCYILYNGVFRAIELKVDDNPVMMHQWNALYQVVANRGFAFVVRFVNASRTLIVENLTNADSRIFKSDPSERQILEQSTLDIEEPAWRRSSMYAKAVEYIMSFESSPLEEQVQKIIKENYQKMIKEKLEKIGKR